MGTILNIVVVILAWVVVLIIRTDLQVRKMIGKITWKSTPHLMRVKLAFGIMATKAKADLGWFFKIVLWIPRAIFGLVERSTRPQSRSRQSRFKTVNILPGQKRPARLSASEMASNRKVASWLIAGMVLLVLICVLGAKELGCLGTQPPVVEVATTDESERSGERQVTEQATGKKSLRERVSAAIGKVLGTKATDPTPKSAEIKKSVRKGRPPGKVNFVDKPPRRKVAPIETFDRGPKSDQRNLFGTIVTIKRPWIIKYRWWVTGALLLGIIYFLIRHWWWDKQRWKEKTFCVIVWALFFAFCIWFLREPLFWLWEVMVEYDRYVY